MKRNSAIRTARPGKEFLEYDPVPAERAALHRAQAFLVLRHQVAWRVSGIQAPHPDASPHPVVSQASALLVGNLAEARPEIEDGWIYLAKAAELVEELLLNCRELSEPLRDLSPLPQVMPRCLEGLVAQSLLKQQRVIETVVVQESSEAVAEVPWGERHQREIATSPFPRLVLVHPERRLQRIPAE